MFDPSINLLFGDLLRTLTAFDAVTEGGLRKMQQMNLHTWLLVKAELLRLKWVEVEGETVHLTKRGEEANRLYNKG